MLTLRATSGGHDYPWPLLLALAIGVLVPTASIVWFMSEAIRNERLAVQQKLVDIYRGQLFEARAAYRAHWQDKQTHLNNIDLSQNASKTFAEIVNNHLAESAVIFGNNNKPLYPDHSETLPRISLPTPWLKAQQLEHTYNNPIGAADLYASIAAQASDATIQARALQAQARCLVKAAKIDDALELLLVTLANSRFRDATDLQGRLIQPSAQLRALQLMQNQGSTPVNSEWQTTVDSLGQRLIDYSDTKLIANQRLFLIKQLHLLTSDQTLLPLLTAENLAAAYLENNVAQVFNDTGLRLYPSHLPGVWRLSAAMGTLQVLYSTERISKEFATLVQNLTIPDDVLITLLPPDTNESLSEILTSIPSGDYLPGWHLGLKIKNESPFSSAADRQIAAYLWTAILLVITLIIIAFLTARHIVGQMRQNQLKNDLIATISHELKTPLASIRVLVDTLLNEDHQDERTTGEYLQLIAKENMRLSHLIDNFLTFSRMERNKHAFDFIQVQATDLTTTALDAVREKFEAAAFTLEAEIQPELPAIKADANFLVTALINLLDNAYKYSAENKHVVLRAYTKEKTLCFEVQDHGIGLSRRHSRKIFERFYRVDRSLTQVADGCGLGLNIVDLIVKAHNGNVTVESTPGKGSTFTLILPLTEEL